MTVSSPTFKAFVKLGKFLRDFCDNRTTKDENALLWTDKLQSTIIRAEQENGWFTEENIRHSLSEWGAQLTEEHLRNWLSAYEKPDSFTPKKVAIIMAGNIPLVGFHDFLCVLLTGHEVLLKLSSNDQALLQFVVAFLVDAEPELQSKITFEKGQLSNFDAVIATGSNNTGRYFEYYFGKKPHIIRKNRNSVAVLSGDESKEELQLLGEDIFRYYGLGCRSVSKLFIPSDFELDGFFKAIYDFHPIINQNKYANNYDYNKAVYLMSEINILDNGFLLLKEDETYASPIGTLFFERYSDVEQLKKRLEEEKDQLQCIVGKGFAKNEVAFGTTQSPSLSDYADGVDTITFLIGLS